MVECGSREILECRNTAVDMSVGEIIMGEEEAKGGVIGR